VIESGVRCGCADDQTDRNPNRTSIDTSIGWGVTPGVTATGAAVLDLGVVEVEVRDEDPSDVLFPMGEVA